MSQARFIVADALEGLASLPDNSVDLILTSPPFLALRNYLPEGHPDKEMEMGSEGTPAEFLDALLDVVEACDRVLAPHGSLVFELGDTYSGSGGAGGDYNPDGLRSGQPGFTGSGRRRADRPEGGSYGRRPVPGRFDTRYSTVENGRTGPGRTRADREGWPLDKSLCGIPQAFELSLIWGCNILRPERQTERWRVRNLAAWCRPNPPVGALSDKFRPGTSYLTIATKARDRYFDQEAVRQPPSPNTNPRTARGVASRPRDTKTSPDGNRQTLALEHMDSGAPPLDWWQIPTEPYKGSHYATWPTDLLHTPILSMCPERVCLSCGKPSLRLTQPINTPMTGFTRSRSSPRDRTSTGPELGGNITLGWTHCSCGEGCRATTWTVKITEVQQGRASDGKWYDLDEWPDEAEPSALRTKRKRKRLLEDLGECVDPSHWRRGVVLDPFVGSGTTLAVATGHGRDAIGLDLDERNVELARQRVGMFLTIEEGTRSMNCPACGAEVSKRDQHYVPSVGHLTDLADAIKPYWSCTGEAATVVAQRSRA